MPSVGINALLLESPYSGTATYTRNLCDVLPEVAPDFGITAYVRGIDVGASNATVVRVRSPSGVGSGALASRTSKLLWEEVVVPVVSAARKDSLLHYPYLAAPVAATAPVIVTVHDLIPLVMAGYHRSRQSRLYADFMARTVARASAIITVSNYSRDEIVRVLGVPNERVHVIYEAASSTFTSDVEPGEAQRITERYRLPPRFVLYLGAAERRKNLELLVRAWKPISQTMLQQGTSLVIVARFPPPDALYPDIRGLAADLDVQGIHFVPAVEEVDKPAVFRAATAFLFPSTYEGFGLPPLEAMASGTPVIASNVTSIPEVVGDACILLPPSDISAWSDAIEQLVRSPASRSALAERGLEQAARFSWKQTGKQTADVYRRVLAA